MAATDYGIEKIGSFLQGDAVSLPNYMAFGTGSAAFVDSENYLNAEIDSSLITKAWVGADVQYSAILTTVQANGSSIGEIGLGVGSPAGSTLWSRDISAIGDKDNTFTATVYVTWKVSRG